MRVLTATLIFIFMKMLMAAFRNVWMAAVTLGDKWWTCKWSNKEIIYDSIYVGWHI